MAPRKRLALIKSQKNSKVSRKDDAPANLRPAFSTPAAIVSFYVTENGDEKKFVIHREHACHYSPVLKAAFNSHFTEGQTGEYRIDDTTHGAFGLLVQWLYYLELDLVHLEAGFDEDFESNGKILNEERKFLFQLWILADKFSIPGLQNYVADCIKESARFFKNFFPTIAFSYVYNNTLPDSRLRKLLVMLTATYLHHEVVQRESAKFPRQFLTDLVVFMMEKCGDKFNKEELSSMVEDLCYVPTGGEYLTR